MAVSESDDASDIFWPGYVDAVSNLAINLLFVIAVMAIVVLATTLQVLHPAQGQPGAGGLSDTAKAKSTIAGDPKQLELLAAEKSKVEKALEDSQQQVKELTQQLQQTQNEQVTSQAQTVSKTEFDKLQQELNESKANLTQARQALSQSQAKTAGQEATPGSDNQQAENADSSQNPEPSHSETYEVIKATQKAGVTAKANAIKQVNSGIKVVFDSDAVDLVENEAKELVAKLTASGSLAQRKWHLSVVSPKGFSEATRLAYYRLQAVRNILLKNGVPASAIEMQVIESKQASANNANVLVKPQ